jgi:putative ABC transport system permease protein
MMLKFFRPILSRTPLGWLQLSRNKGRFFVALSGIAFADLLMFMQLGFQAALYDSNTRLHRDLRADLVLISPQALNFNYPHTFPRRRLYQALSVPGVNAVDSLYVENVTWRNPQTRQEALIRIIGFNPDRPAFDLPDVNQQLGLIKLPETVLFDRGSNGQYDQLISRIEKGHRVKTEMERRSIFIGGLFKVGASFGADGQLITSTQNLLVLFPQHPVESVNIGLIKLQAGYDISRVADTLKAQLPSDVRIFTKQEFVEFEQRYWAQASPIGFIFGLGTTMAFIVGVVIVYQVLSSDVNDHISEYATFKAMGYREVYLLSIVFEQAIILASLGFLPGVAAALGLYSLVRKGTSLPIYMTIGRLLLVSILTLIMCCLSGAISTRNVRSADPADNF